MRLKEHIFLEGPDGSGKTTLFEKLGAKGFNLGYHSGGPPKNVEEMLKRLVTPIEYPAAVIDRYPPISELVYKTAFREDFLIPKPILKAWMQYTNPIIVYCRPSDEAIRNSPVQVKAHKPVEHTSKVRGNRQRIIEIYDRVLQELSMTTRIIQYDWEYDPTAEELIEDLKDMGSCVD